MFKLVKLDNVVWVDPDEIEAISQQPRQLVMVFMKSGAVHLLQENETLDSVLDRLKGYKLQLMKAEELSRLEDEMHIGRDDILARIDQAYEMGTLTEHDLKKWVDDYFEKKRRQSE